MKIAKFINTIKEDLKEVLYYNMLNRTKCYIIAYECQEVKEEEEIYNMIELKLKEYKININDYWKQLKERIYLFDKVKINDNEDKKYYIIKYILHLFSILLYWELADLKYEALQRMYYDE